MSRFDLHVHTEHSADAHGSVLEIAEQAAAAGLHGFCITDHDTIAGHADIVAASQATGLLIIPGVEVTTAEGHILAIGVNKNITRGASVADTVAEINAQGGVAIAAHPLRFLTGIGPSALQNYVEQGILIAAETINARERKLVSQNTAEQVSQLGISATGGSDTHWKKDIGIAYTVFDRRPKNAKEVVKMIKDGLCHAGGATTRRRSVVGHQLSLVVPPLRRKVLAKQGKREA